MSTLRLVLVVLSVLLLSSTPVSSLICWLCASDSLYPEFCQEQLNLTQLTVQQRNFYYKECTPPTQRINEFGQRLESRCRIQLRRIHGQDIYSRSCVVEPETNDRNACLERSIFPEVKIVACETCTTNGCNERFSKKISEIVAENNAGMKTIISMKLFSVILGVFWFSL